MEILILGSSGWTSVSLPKGFDPTWSDADKYFYAARFVAAQESGFSEKRSAQLAEAAVSKRLYPGLEFDCILEVDLRKL